MSRRQEKEREREGKRKGRKGKGKRKGRGIAYEWFESNLMSIPIQLEASNRKEWLA